MLGFSKKRFFVTLGLSVLVWYITVIIQGVTGFNAPLNLPFSGSPCQVTGFPAATCIKPGSATSVWIVNLMNTFFWFWVIHLFWGWFEKGKD